MNAKLLKQCYLHHKHCKAFSKLCLFWFCNRLAEVDGEERERELVAIILMCSSCREAVCVMSLFLALQWVGL